MFYQYNPLQPGIPKRFASEVTYCEIQPLNPYFKKAVYCIWELQSRVPLSEPFSYLVFPDCCIDVVFDVINKSNTALIMTPATAAIILHLGQQFRYVGIRVYPGSWNNAWGISSPEIVASPDPIPVLIEGIDDQIELIQNNKNTPTIAALLEQFLVQQEVPFKPMQRYILNLLQGSSVQDTAFQSGYSTRQLSRRVFAETGFSPREIIRMGKVQRVINDVQSTAYLHEYYDQPHFIREFKQISGYTPAEYAELF